MGNTAQRRDENRAPRTVAFPDDPLTPPFQLGMPEEPPTVAFSNATVAFSDNEHGLYEV